MNIYQLFKLKAHCEDHNFPHVYPQFTYMIFIYSYSYIFTIIGYMTNLQLTIYPCGLDSSVDRALHRYHKVMGSGPVQAWIFFRLLFQLLKLKAHWLRGSQFHSLPIHCLPKFWKFAKKVLSIWKLRTAELSASFANIILLRPKQFWSAFNKKSSLFWRNEKIVTWTNYFIHPCPCFHLILNKIPLNKAKPIKEVMKINEKIIWDELSWYFTNFSLLTAIRNE